ncbi:phosphotransferase [Streptomyces clavuligerus]|nr:phosphotransferase [Streptomyces clavuligerus]WDN54669.1 phosphotransferase [Streptomyces clavuligerus]
MQQHTERARHGDSPRNGGAEPRCGTGPERGPAVGLPRTTHPADGPVGTADGPGRRTGTADGPVRTADGPACAVGGTVRPAPAPAPAPSAAAGRTPSVARPGDPPSGGRFRAAPTGPGEHHAADDTDTDTDIGSGSGPAVPPSVPPCAPASASASASVSPSGPVPAPPPGALFAAAPGPLSGPLPGTVARPLRSAGPPVRPGTGAWVRALLARHWGLDPGRTAVRPLLVDGAAPLSHTAGLWEADTRGVRRVLKVRLNPDALRPSALYELKEAIGDHCRRAGVPVGEAVPALDGRAGVWCDGTVSELAPRYGGALADPADPTQAAAVVRCGLRLRRALDTVPGPLRDELAGLPLPSLVEVEDWRAALADAARLLTTAERRTDRWSRLAADALRPAVASGPLLDERLTAPGGRPRPPAVIHSDLHPHHFVLVPSAEGPPPPAEGPLPSAEDPPHPAGGPPPGADRAVRAVLDFDNLQTGDPLLDLAWLAEAAGRVAGAVARRRALTAFLGDARRLGLLGPGEETLLMPLLMAHSLPVVVDIAKDILERGDLSPQWPGYFALLSPERRLGVHRCLVAAGRAL